MALNDLGRILFLQRKYADAVNVLQSVLAVDPEDLQAHYNLMLCYNGLGDEKQAHEHEVRYLRFKADEASQAITGPYRQLNPEDNNERQAIHEHVSVPLAQVTRDCSSTARPSEARLIERLAGLKINAQEVFLHLFSWPHPHLRSTSSFATSLRKLASISSTTMAPSEKSIFPRPWVRVVPSSTTTTTAGLTFCW